MCSPFLLDLDLGSKDLDLTVAGLVTSLMCTVQPIVNANTQRNRPVVDVAGDAQCCVHTRDSSCRGQAHRWTDGWTDTVRQ